ncbi:MULTISPECIES: hypothetical protein [Moraxella]|jgi:hypothetical protein|uniref:Uncharacterized protein n=1 Tax=Moraxella lacunata TaxID=477 RepID=A0A1B8Q894_MORLA|nr:MULTISPECIES: hypothetical protein [Moraxella]MCG7412047.1 hypothetical protein [Moraxella nonliquefaciens]MDI4482787.1 hypothetical protein [Moraxella lacunata]MDI4507256.1 hypothetical protein [Moraxella lacunata]OBX61397.1 hypothetical protein A9Z63_08145 [Moraxella lacunata]OBX67253.1 hypothetical protein A9309_01195 [Moraxella lacunata]
MSDTYIVLTISIVATIVQAIFWRWVATLSSSQDENRLQISTLKSEVSDLRAEMYRNYQSKSDAHIDNQRILDSLSDLKADVKELGHKLDKKADK